MNNVDGQIEAALPLDILFWVSFLGGAAVWFSIFGYWVLLGRCIAGCPEFRSDVSLVLLGMKPRPIVS